MTTTPLDKEILQEIVRVVQTKRAVPDTVEVGSKRYALTYLNDHQERMTDALASQDLNMLNILFGQLASKVKYQAVPIGPGPARAGSAKGAGKKKAFASPRKQRSGVSPTTAQLRSKPRRVAIGTAAKEKNTKGTLTRSSQSSPRRKAKPKK